MTRSELLETAIANARTAIFCQQHGDYEFPALQEVRKFTLDLLLAEQKRSEGCAVCRGEAHMKDKNVCSDDDCWNAVRFVSGEMQVRNTSEYGWTRVKATHCPECGRDLTEGESV